MKFSRVAAYSLAVVPAVIGVWFVARFAYVTSDTPIEGASNAFLFGMIAVGAYVGPAVALVVGSRGRALASTILWALALLAIVTNWSQTLGAVASRGSAAEAERAKASAIVRDDRARLARIESELAASSKVVDGEAVKAAQAAVQTAERNRAAECERRGPHCRARETDEQSKRDTLAAILAGKAATDQAAKLNEEASTIRARLATTPAVKEANALGEALGRLLPISATTAATAQQGLISAIVELLIAAALALPELLRGRPGRGVNPEEPVIDELAARRGQSAKGSDKASEEPVGGAAIDEGVTPGKAPEASGNTPEGPVKANGAAVARFMLACLPRAKGHEAEVGAIYNRFQVWCAEQEPALEPLDPRSFAHEFKTWCARGKIRARRVGGKIIYLDVRVA